MNFEQILSDDDQYLCEECDLDEDSEGDYDEDSDDDFGESDSEGEYNEDSDMDFDEMDDDDFWAMVDEELDGALF